MRIRERVVAVVRWLWEPRVAIVTGLVLIAGSTVAIAATWPPTRGTLRPFIVGTALILRGIALPHIRRQLRRLRRSLTQGGDRSTAADRLQRHDEPERPTHAGARR